MGALTALGALASPGCVTDDSVSSGPATHDASGAEQAVDDPAGEGEGEGESEPAGGVRDWTPQELALAQAKGRFPDFAAFSAGVIQRTCSPNPGVCHQTNNYPDLHTDANALNIVGAPCNIEMPDPTQGWDRCERAGDRIRAGDYEGTIGRIEKVSAGKWTLTVRPAPGIDGFKRPVITRANGDVLLDPPDEFFLGLKLERGKEVLQLTTLATADAQMIVDEVLATVIVGDPNQNGVYGADEPEGLGAMVVPGDPESSYLWGRLTGTVPGFRMPLANQPLSLDEYIALACWIEGLDPDDAGPDSPPPAGDAPIDYDNCAFAAAPVDYSAAPTPEESE